MLKAKNAVNAEEDLHTVANIIVGKGMDFKEIIHLLIKQTIT